MKSTSRVNIKAYASAAVALVAGLATPVLAQDESASVSAGTGNDIIVTAQRIEQRLQDVPISITVFDQQTLSDNNVVSARDLASFTPGMTVSTRNGNDATTFTIRGFSQELRTTATVATYFADVVAPRGGGVNAGGDGAGPGQLFDLQNVQVLKGPQGTLFGRNTTGGAVLLVPRKPTGDLEGYVEGTVGRFDLRRVQAVVNLPVNDTLRVRLGVDRNVRDGYLRNIGLGPKDLGNVDYWAVRASVVADLMPGLENYTIVSYNSSKSNGVVPKATRCFPNSTASQFGFTSPTLGSLACAQIARAADQNFWTVQNPVPTARSNQTQWQVINTTTWEAADNLTIKNIFSYAEFENSLAMDIYGGYLAVGASSPAAVTSPTQVITAVGFYPEASSGRSNRQSSLVEELQFQGRSGDGNLTWQAGLYFESSRPLGWAGAQSSTYTPCANAETFDCVVKTPNLSAGSLSWAQFRNSFRSMAAYAQASYDLTDSLTATGGLRYTHDKSSSRFQTETINLPAGAAPYARCVNRAAPGFGANFPIAERFANCEQSISTTSEKPTWLVGLDFKPIDDLLLYAKYTRGYRQGSVAPYSPDGEQVYKPEKVDTYELGGKMSWRGALPGAFNISAYYNDFQDQQLQIGLAVTNPSLTATTAIVNVGKSRIYGLETDLAISPFTGLNLSAAYSYVNSRLLEVTPYVAQPGYLPFAPVAGGRLPFAVPHSFTGSASYTLPLPESIGEVSFGGTVVYQAGYITGSQAYTVLPEQTFGNVNLNWDGIAGMPLDASLFITNVTNEKLYTNAIDRSGARSDGFVAYLLGEPRMWGVRLRYHFGR